MRHFKTIIFTLFTSLVFGQNFTSSNPEYIRNVKQGEAALIAGDYKTCLEHYESAFNIKHTSTLSTMRAAACAFGNEDQRLLTYYLDTSFSLNISTSKQAFDNMPEFDVFRGTELERRVHEQWENGIIAKGYNLTLMSALEEIGKSDQAQRSYMREYSEKYGWKSPEMDSLWAIQSFTDSVNLLRVKDIIATHGYPGRDLVGDRLASGAFLVIQHSDIETQNEYLPILKAAADEGQLKWSSLALLIDRVNLGNGKSQIYGSQIHTDQETGAYYFAEIEEPFKVDSLRASVGLGSLQDYADNWSITWDPIKHVERHKMMKEK